MKTDPNKYGYTFNIHGVDMLAVCAKRSRGYVLSKAIVDAINAEPNIICTANVGNNNDVDISCEYVFTKPKIIDVEFDIKFCDDEAS